MILYVPLFRQDFKYLTIFFFLSNCFKYFIKMLLLWSMTLWVIVGITKTEPALNYLKNPWFRIITVLFSKILPILQFVLKLIRGRVQLFLPSQLRSWGTYRVYAWHVIGVITCYKKNNDYDTTWHHHNVLF